MSHFEWLVKADDLSATSDHVKQLSLVGFKTQYFSIYCDQFLNLLRKYFNRSIGVTG
jgi:hypothetical protein